MPGPAAELMFAPLELGFPRRRHPLGRVRRQPRGPPPGRQAQGRRRPDRPRGVRTATTAPRSRPPSARISPASWRRVLGGGDRPPLLRSALSLAVAGRDAEAARGAGRAPARVLRPRRSCTAPAASSTASSSPRCPPTTFPLPEYKEHLLPDQLGAMVPHAISHAGSRIGPYIGHTLTGSRSAGPVRPRRGLPAATARRPACSPAASARGKTICLELLVWQAFLQGSGPIVDIDPKGDHASTACPASPSRSRRSSSPPTSATAACSTRCGSAPRRPARTSPTTSSSRSCRRRSSRSGRRSCASRSPRRPPRGARSCGEVARPPGRLGERRGRSRSARAIEVHGSSRPRQARARRPPTPSCPRSAAPRSSRCGSAT